MADGWLTHINPTETFGFHLYFKKILKYLIFSENHYVHDPRPLFASALNCPLHYNRKETKRKRRILSFYFPLTFAT
ncbi:MAG TPA: hypothetical protein DCP28_02200 [Cytophagales bacterium]|nr:hypothetical protein [Cytophagales bacterium]